MPEKLRVIGNKYLLLGLLLVSCNNSPTPTVLPTETLTPRPTETPTLTTTKTATPFPTVSLTPTPTLTHDRSSPFLATLKKHAKEIRIDQAKKDPEYANRIDAQLAMHAVLTIQMMGCGWDHEPPVVEKVYICSNSLFVFTKDAKMHVITFTHDTRAPEAEQAAGISGKQNSTMRLERTVDGGPELIRKTFQNATGFPIDYIFIFDDKTITDFVDKIFDGKIEINIPEGFTSQPIYTDANTKIGEKIFKPGRQTLTSIELLQYIKGVVKAEKYPPSLENNVRKHIAIEAIKNELANRFKNPGFVLSGGIKKMIDFLETEKSNKVISTDLPTAISFQITADIVSALALSGNTNFIPEKGIDLYLADPAVTGNPNMPMRWGLPQSGDRFIIRDVGNKIYPPGYVEVPTNCDATSSKLYQDCWQDVRKYIKSKIPIQ